MKYSRKWKYPLTCFAFHHCKKGGSSRESELVNLYCQILIEDFTITSSSHVNNWKCCPGTNSSRCLLTFGWFENWLFFLFLLFSLSQSDKENNISDWRNQLNNPLRPCTLSAFRKWSKKKIFSPRKKNFCLQEKKHFPLGVSLRVF